MTKMLGCSHKLDLQRTYRTTEQVKNNPGGETVCAHVESLLVLMLLIADTKFHETISDSTQLI